MRTKRAITGIELCRSLAEVGIIPQEMMDSITAVSIELHPNNEAILKLDVVIDDRIYSIIDPRVRKLFTPEGHEQ